MGMVVMGLWRSQTRVTQFSKGKDGSEHGVGGVCICSDGMESAEEVSGESTWRV